MGPNQRTQAQGLVLASVVQEEGSHVHVQHRAVHDQDSGAQERENQVYLRINRSLIFFKHILSLNSKIKDKI